MYNNLGFAFYRRFSKIYEVRYNIIFGDL